MTEASKTIHGPFPFAGVWEGQDVLWTARGGSPFPYVYLVLWNKDDDLPEPGRTYGVYNAKYHGSGTPDDRTGEAERYWRLGGAEGIPFNDPANDGNLVPTWPGRYWQGATVCNPGDLSGADVGGGYPHIGTTVAAGCNDGQGDPNVALAMWEDVVRKIPTGSMYAWVWYSPANFGNSSIVFSEFIVMGGAKEPEPHDPEAPPAQDSGPPEPGKDDKGPFGFGILPKISKLFGR